MGILSKHIDYIEEKNMVPGEKLLMMLHSMSILHQLCCLSVTASIYVGILQLIQPWQIDPERLTLYCKRKPIKPLIKI